MTRVHEKRLSPEHQEFISKVQKGVEHHKRPRAEKPAALCVFGYEFDSKLEVDFANFLELWREEKRIDEWRYHPLKFRLAKSVTYEPDFLTRARPYLGAPYITSIYEVKGSWKQKGGRDSRTRLQIAASMYQWFSWYGVTREDGEWVFETIHASSTEET